MLLRLICFTVFLSGCDLSPTLENKVELYIDSLNRYEKFSIPKVSQRFPAISLPSPRQRLQNLTVFDVSLIEFLSLQNCDIGYYVGEKNSVLGKVMTHSQRLIYETNMIRAIEQCDLDSVSVSNQLKDELKNIAKIKRQELRKAFSNAMWAGEEASRFFSVSNGYLPMNMNVLDYQNLTTSLQELAKIANQLQTLPNLNSNLLEEHLKAVYYSEYGGQLLLTLIFLSDTLNLVADGLNQLSTNSKFCNGPIIFLKQNMQQHYLESLQPYMAKINSTAYTILSKIDELQQVGLGDNMNRFLSQFSLSNKDSIWHHYQSASLQHAKAWDRILRDCNAFY